MLASGWNDSDDQRLSPYKQRQNKLSLQDGCVLWGSRVVIPPQGREKILEELHHGHPGTSWMKNLARSFVWWSGIDKDLEAKVKHCDPCHKSRKLTASAPIQAWEFPKRPWSRLHVDYAGLFQGHMFLVVVDAHSKWLDVKVVKQATSTTRISALRSIFATHGIPELLVSDNGSMFTNAEFKDFLQHNGICHNTLAPYHPATNGLAERSVQTFKAFLKKSSGGSLDDRLSQFLFQYRITPHATTGISPAQLLMGRQPRSRLDLVRPDLDSKVEQQQECQKRNRDKHSKPHGFSVDDSVYILNLPAKDSWLPGTITKVLGLTYEVRLSDNRTVRRHIDHIQSQATDQHSVLEQLDWLPIPDGPSVPPSDPRCSSTSSTSPVAPGTPLKAPLLRRSTRVSVPPDRLVNHYPPR